MYFSTVSTLIYSFSQWYARGRNALWNGHVSSVRDCACPIKPRKSAILHHLLHTYQAAKNPRVVPYPILKMHSREFRTKPEEWSERLKHILVYSLHIFVYMSLKYIMIHSHNNSPSDCVLSVWWRSNFRTGDPRLGQICSHDRCHIGEFWAPKWAEPGYNTKFQTLIYW